MLQLSSHLSCCGGTGSQSRFPPSISRSARIASFWYTTTASCSRQIQPASIIPIVWAAVLQKFNAMRPIIRAIGRSGGSSTAGYGLGIVDERRRSSFGTIRATRRVEVLRAASCRTESATHPRAYFATQRKRSGRSRQCWGVHVKHFGVSPGRQGRLSHTPSGPLSSWHRAPISRHSALGPGLAYSPRSQPRQALRSTAAKARPITCRRRSGERPDQAAAARRSAPAQAGRRRAMPTRR